VAQEQAAAYLPQGWQQNPVGEVDFLYSLRLAPPNKRRGQRNFHLLYCGSELLARTLKLPALWSTFEKHTELVTAFYAKDRLFVHAGVVGWQGRAILIPGRSMSGKSTLVKALVETGATYYSDEYAILDKKGLVHPYSVPLSIRGNNSQPTRKIQIESLDGRAGVDPLPVGLVVETEFQPGAEWQPVVLTPGLALLALMNNTVAARREPTHTMPILKKVVSGPVALKSKRGEAKEVAPLLLAQLEESL
jgi:hypothetical protein